MATTNQEKAKFWWQLIETLSSEDPWYDGFRPKRNGKLKQSAIEHDTDKDGVWLCFRWRNKWRGREDRVEVTVTIQGLGLDRANNYLSHLRNHKKSIESKLTREIYDWEEAIDGSETARIITEVPRDEWDKCIIDLRDTMNEYRNIIEPHFKDLKDLKDMYYYVIKFHNTSDGDPWGKAGTTVYLRRRYKEHLRKFSNHPTSANWELGKMKTKYFATGEEAKSFEERMKNIEEIRSPKIKHLSDELFSSNPLDYAREKGWIE